MKTILLSAAFLVACASPLFAENPTGFWTGTYEYPGGVGEGVSFSIAVRTAFTSPDSEFATGKSIEVNTFGATDTPALGATITIRIFENNRVEMVKTYDGSGGVSHTVWYTGKYHAERGTIKGTWYISNGASGPFSMKRQAVQ